MEHYGVHHERVKALLRQERELGKRGSREVLENVLKIEPKEEEESVSENDDDSRSSLKAAGLFALDDSPGEALDPLEEKQLVEVKVEESEEDSVVNVSDDDSIVEVEMEKCELCNESFGAQYQINVHIALAHFREGLRRELVRRGWSEGDERCPVCGRRAGRP